LREGRGDLMPGREDLGWIVENSEVLTEKYAGKYLIVYGKRIVVADESLRKALRTADELIPRAEYVVHYVVPPKLMVI